MFKYILFDLDGTLTDPKEGICKSVQYALKKHGIEEADIDKLEPFIGPPLLDSFMEYYNMDNEEATIAINDYRERFSTIGLYENAVYPGIVKLLAKLKKRQIKLAVASSKPTVYVEKILAHFKLKNYFDVIVGSELDGRRTAKDEVIEEALMELYFGKESKATKLDECSDYIKETAMVGDRSLDIEGAKAHQIFAIGVDYGYAEYGELKQAGAGFVADTVAELEAFLLDRNRVSAPLPNVSFFRAIYALVPFVVYYMMMVLAEIVGLQYIRESERYSKLINVPAFSAKASGIITTIAMIFGGLMIFILFIRTDKMPFAMNTSYKKKNSKLVAGIVTVISGGLLALGLNLLVADIVELLPYFDDSYQASSVNRLLPFGIGVLLYVIVSPIVEELAFRWLVYGRVRRLFSPMLAVPFVSILFGAYHGNIVQGTYATLMSIAICLVYEWTGSLLSPLLFHAGANLVVYFAPYIPQNAAELLCKPISIVVMLGVSIVILMYLYSIRFVKKRKERVK